MQTQGPYGSAATHQSTHFGHALGTRLSQAHQTEPGQIRGCKVIHPQLRDSQEGVPTNHLGGLRHYEHQC